MPREGDGGSGFTRLGRGAGGDRALRLWDMTNPRTPTLSSKRPVPHTDAVPPSACTTTAGRNQQPQERVVFADRAVRTAEGACPFGAPLQRLRTVSSQTRVPLLHRALP
jgi:hypothetical protein